MDIEPFAATSQTVRQKELNELSNVVKLENVMENNANVTEEHITFKRRSLVPFSFDGIEPLHEVITNLHDHAISPMQLRKRAIHNPHAIRNQHKYMGKHAHVSCPQCAQQTDMKSLNVSESKLYDYFVRNNTAWFESNIIELFTLLQIHENHPKNIFFLFLIDPILANDDYFNNLSTIKLGHDIKNIVSIGCNGQHFCTIELIPEKKRVNIYDGLKMPFSSLKMSLRYAFRRLGQNFVHKQT